jgi:tRNA dimethylallyltransferase
MLTLAVPPLVLLAGPTATGKTALAVRTALRLGGEIVSADSMQIYRGCVIGAAQPTPKELSGIPCHLVGCVEPRDTWSVADWLGRARALIDAIRARGRAVVVAGGTGLYFKALDEGLFEAAGAGRHESLRRRLEEEWNADGGQALRRRLEEADPEAARRVHVNDRLRVVRALEVYEATRRPMSVLQAEARGTHARPAASRFVLCSSRAELYRRINARVLEMMRRGFVEEVERLLANGAREEWPAMRALGYRQMLRLIRGQMGREEAIEETQRQSRRYAKQQIVLFRKWPGAVWLDIARGEEKNARVIEKTLEISSLSGV